MAESFVFSIGESLLAKLASREYEQASRVLGVYDSLQELKHTLSNIKAVLLDAEQMQEHSHEIRDWLRQVKRVFSYAENVLDDFECETLQKQVIKAHGTTKTKVSRFFSGSNLLVFRYKMAKQIKDINKRLHKIAANRDKSGLRIIEVDRHVVHTRELIHSHVIESDVVGRDRDREKIIELLMQHDSNKSISVIPIVGMGGLGKTTLSKLVFNDERIQECFPIKMWVYVSGEFDIKKLIIEIINSAQQQQQNLNDLDIQQVQTYLKDMLVGKKFLLVLDDVWNEDRVKWVELRDLLAQVGDEGSKILVTTRSRSIGSLMGTVPSYILEGLSLDDSLSLFVKRAFRDGEEKKYPHLVNIGREIVKNCGGIPLAVTISGCLLFSKFEVIEWENVRRNEIWNLQQRNYDILHLLKVSYDPMPYYLRHCFALFSLFPKDYLFDSSKVTSLWGTLGLLPMPKKNKTLEDVANQYLRELHSRSFLQDFFNFGTSYYFRIHDMMHNLARFVAKDECLVVDSSNQNISENIRHLCIVENVLHGQSSTSDSVAVRTVRFVGAKDGVLLDTWVSKYKYLRYLDLSDSTFETLPYSIGNLKHLRYLSIADNKNIKRLPDSICKLQNLQVFHLSGCTKLEALPNGFRNLISLRELQITTRLSILPLNEIANLNSLEILSISESHNVESMSEGMKFSTLKTLKLECCRGLKSLPLDFNSFPELETLFVTKCDNLDLELSKGLDEISPKLKLKSIFFDQLPQLVSLPEWVLDAANTLIDLTVMNCNNLEVLPDWLSTLTNLKTLIICCCPKFNSLPDNIHHLTALETLWIAGNRELWTKCQPEVGEYWPKISHIKQLDIILQEDSEEAQAGEESF